VKEAAELSQNPSPDYVAYPLEDNIFEWHFTLRGPPAPSPFANGLYHGKITLPSAYPLRPPSFRFLTPSGRFECNREICLSISGFHEESWQPAWGIRTALLALRGHMDVEARGQVGGLDADVETRKQLAARSGAFVCSSCGKSNNAIIEEKEKEFAELGDGAKKPEEEVPAELRLAYREDLGSLDEETSTSEQNQLQLKKATPEDVPQELRPQAEQQAAAALLQLGRTGQLPQPARAQARPGTEDAWLELLIWTVGALLTFILARKILMVLFT
jgi:ubiquitin-conjugating enzyme E2 J1